MNTPDRRHDPFADERPTPVMREAFWDGLRGTLEYCMDLCDRLQTSCNTSPDEMDDIAHMFMRLSTLGNIVLNREHAERLAAEAAKPKLTVIPGGKAKRRRKVPKPMMTREERAARRKARIQMAAPPEHRDGWSAMVPPAVREAR